MKQKILAILQSLWFESYMTQIDILDALMHKLTEQTLSTEKEEEVVH